MAEQTEGFVELRNGMNGLRNPALLGDTQCAKAINVSFRGGLATTRPAFVKAAVTIPAGEFRGCGRWSLERGDLLVFVVAKGLYTLTLNTMSLAQQATLTSETGQCFFVQADRYLVVNDGVNTPTVLEDVDGTTTLVTSGVSIPTGTLAIFAHGRIHMVPTLVPNTTLSGKAYLISGDILEPDTPATVLRFSETEYLAEGGAHQQPMEMGFIGGLGVLRNAQTGTGLGSIIALSRNGVCAYDFSILRSQWEDQAISQALFMGPGCRSPWSVVNVNDDLVFRGLDGLRTLRYTSSQVAGSSGSLSNTPISQEVTNFLKGDEAWLPYVSTAVYDNRLFTTCSNAGTHAFKGLISWDLGAAYYNGVSAPGVYDGLWTGRNFYQVISALVDYKPRVFAFTDAQELLYLDEDTVRDPLDTPIEAKLETKTYWFGDMVSTKKLMYAELWLTDLSDTTSVTVRYRPHGYPLWKTLSSRTVTVPEGSLPQMKSKLRFSVDFSEENCNPMTDAPLYCATGFQFAVEWTGRATVERFRAVCEPVLDPPPDPCDDATGVVLAASSAAGETLNDYSYSIKTS